MPTTITATEPGPELSAVTREILDRLPAWFGIPDASRGYVDAACRLPGWVARLDGTACGVVLLAATRAFYLARGFEPLEEFQHLWPGNPCLLMVKVL
ncbi:MAG: hypothetical protein ACR2JU_09905 [Nocardioidaceae bacterium]